MNRKKFKNKTSISDINSFRGICAEAVKNESIYNNFKSLNDFTFVLEHVTQDLGEQYIVEIEKNLKFDLCCIKKFKENDIQGSPKKFYYKEPYGLISPTTLRYIKVLNDLIDNFESLNDLSIIEIGVGYGGQAKIIQDCFDVKSYYFVDLPEVNQLAEKYLSKFGYKNNYFLDFEDLPNYEYDLVISNYALTECTKSVQNYYYNKIIKKSKHGYIIGNDIGSHYRIKNHNKEDWANKIGNCKIIPEQPSSDSENRNYILIF